MKAVRIWITGAAFSFALALSGTVSAQQGLPQVEVPVVPYYNGADGSQRNWRDQVEADRKAKGWSGTRATSTNWSDRYGYGQREYDGKPWDQIRQPRAGLSQRTQPSRDVQRLQAMEAQAQAYQRLYWMMREKIEADQANR